MIIQKIKAFKEENHLLVHQINDLQCSIGDLEKDLTTANQEKKDHFFENKRLKLTIKKLENVINNNSLQ